MSDTKFDIDAMKAKIAKLLAKAERTDSQEERDSFTEKAERLMIKLGINAAELEAAGDVKPEDIVRVERFYNQYAVAYVPAAYSAALAFGNLNMIKSGSGQKQWIYVIGHKSDVDNFLVIWDSIVLQSKAALRQWQRETREERKDNTSRQNYVASRSFVVGYGQIVSRRIRETRRQEVAEASTGAALVLASKDDRIRAWMDENLGPLGKGRSSKMTHSGQGYRAGQRAGQRANIGGTAIGGTKGALS